jgi:acetolactate synthase-1/2/3 large subunit
MVTAAPGATNALGPLFTARQSESPILFLTGDSSRAQDGKGAFQELDQVPITAPLTKLSFRATCARDIGTETDRAIRTALSGRPGPVHMALPFDVIEADAAGGTLPSPQDMTRDTAALSDEDTQKIAGMIGAAKTPLILCGPVMNATRQGDLTAALAKATDAPVIAMESPRGLKDPSRGVFAIAL